MFKRLGYVLRDAREFLWHLRLERAARHAQPETASRFTEGPPLAAGFPGFEKLSVGKSFFTADMYLRQQGRADWQHTDPRIQRFAALLVEALRKRSVPLYVHTAYRTPADQMNMVAQGVSRASPNKARHCHGQAVDIVHSVYHWDLGPAEWAILGKIGKDLAKKEGLPIKWGGDWSFYDPAHWELDLEFPPLPSEGPPVRWTARGLLRRVGQS